VNLGVGNFQLPRLGKFELPLTLSRGTTYHELGPDYYDRRHTERGSARDPGS